MTIMSQAIRNSVLSAMPEFERRALLRNADFEELVPRQTFYAPGMPIRDVFFLEHGMASELVRMSDGRAVDAAPIGIEGLVGLPLLLGADSNQHHSLMQVKGAGFRVPGPHAVRWFKESEEFRTLVLRYAHARFLQATQSVACNLLHTIEQRLARWLMIARFHARKDSFGITQEFLAEMLGANRSTTNVAIRALERAALVNYERGSVEITDPEELSKKSCECSQTMANVFASVTQANSRAAEPSTSANRLFVR